MTEPPTPPTPPPPRGAAGVAALLQENARLRERLERVEAKLEVMDRAIPKIHEKLVAAEQAREADADRRPAVSVPWLPGLAEADADDVLEDLRTWVADVYLARYPREAGRLPPCWSRHEVAVDVLLAVRAAWQAFVVAGTNPDAVARWHLITRPEAAEQIHATLGNCKPGKRGTCALDGPVARAV